MNTFLKQMVDTRSPKITNLSEEEKRAYTVGITMLAITVCEEFVDLPELPDSKYSTDGLFFEIPYFSSETLWSDSNQRCMLVVYKIENKSSMCPLRIDFKFNLKDDGGIDYWLYVYDQSGERSKKLELACSEDGQSYTTIPEYQTIKLSELIGYKRTDLG